MWPKESSKYSLFKKLINNPKDDWRPLTYWQTDVKNLHFVYQLLKYAKDPIYDDGKNWYDRSRKKFTEYGLLNKAGRPTRLGLRFLRYTDYKLSENPNFFNRDNVNPFELEYLFHKSLYEAGSLEVFNNLQSLFKIIPSINVDDISTIVSVVKIDNGDETLKNFNSLDKVGRKELFEELKNLHKELKDVGGLNKAKKIVNSDWSEYLDLISVGALGQQNDGYYRAASLLKAHILLLTFLKIKAERDLTLEQLYISFQNNISKDSFLQLLKSEPEIQENDNIYYYAPERLIVESLANEETYTEEIKTEIQRIQYATLDLSDEERLIKIKTQLRAAEKSPIITVPQGLGRQRITYIRHLRDPKTSANMRLYVKDICQLCGFDGKKEYGSGIAEVDHAIDEISTIQNNRPSNLIVLCPNCHTAKTKGLIKFTDYPDHFLSKNIFSGEEKRIEKLKF